MEYSGLSPLHSFLSNFTLKTAVAVYKVCSLLKSVPFTLESNDCLRVRKFESRWKLLLWHLANFLFYFAANIQFLTYVHTLFGGVRGNAFAVHTIYLMASLFGLVFMLSLYMKPDVCILLMRQHDKLLQTIAGKVVNTYLFGNRESLNLWRLGFIFRTECGHSSMVVTSICDSVAKLHDILSWWLLANHFAHVPLLRKLPLLPVQLYSTQFPNCSDIPGVYGLRNGMGCSGTLDCRSILLLLVCGYLQNQPLSLLSPVRSFASLSWEAFT